MFKTLTKQEIEELLPETEYGKRLFLKNLEAGCTHTTLVRVLGHMMQVLVHVELIPVLEIVLMSIPALEKPPGWATLTPEVLRVLWEIILKFIQVGVLVSLRRHQVKNVVIRAAAYLIVLIDWLQRKTLDYFVRTFHGTQTDTNTTSVCNVEN